MLGALLALSVPLSAQAQQFVASTGGKGNTYSKMFSEFSAACQQDVGTPFVEKESTGSIENLDRILSNEVPAGIVQVDVLHFRSRTDDLSRIKVLFPMHPEEVHIVTRNITRKEGGTMGFGAREVSFSTLSDLRGRKIGSWGGSFVTTQVIRLQSEIDFNVVEFADQAAALTALNDGRVDAIVSVGGNPVGWIQKLDRSYKLLSIGEADAAKLKNVYKPARVSYSNLGQSGVTTVSTDATMVVRDYKTPAFQSMLTKVRGCFEKRLKEIEEKPGNHAKWALVKLDAPSKWPLYEASAEASAPTPNPAKGPKK
jgi:TRAP-type uncharacterized transport system substrate-binding protein